MKHAFILPLFIFLPFSGMNQGKSINNHLKKEVENLIHNFHGQAGIYIKDLRSKKIIAINADTVFPTASMVKVPILVGLMSKIERGELAYHQNLVYKDSLLYEGVDILGSFKNNEQIELSKVILLMLSISDNTASLWLQSLAGGGSFINTLLDSMGFIYTRINSRTPGRELNRTEYGWGQTTPLEMVTLFEKLYRGEIISNTASQKMLRLLSRNYWDEQAIAEIPSTVFVAAKNGAVDESRSETLLVMSPHHPYIFSICTKNITDQRWENDNEAWILARNVSKLLWKYFSSK